MLYEFLVAQHGQDSGRTVPELALDHVFDSQGQVMRLYAQAFVCVCVSFRLCLCACMRACVREPVCVCVCVCQRFAGDDVVCILISWWCRCFYLTWLNVWSDSS